MATNGNGGLAGANGQRKGPQFDPTFTDMVNKANGPKANPRMKEVMPNLIRHLHDFCRESKITYDEYVAATELMNDAGKMSNEHRNEGLLIGGVLGFDTLLDEITSKLASDASDQATASAILGPFWRKDAPIRKMGDSTVHNIPNGDHTWMHGTVTDFKTGKPIDKAELDVWETAPNGLYEQHDPDQVDMNLRGRFITAKDGKYNFYCLRPTAYEIPSDGASGKLLHLLDRHSMRPAHIHFILTAPGYKPLITQLFDRRDKYVADDAAFAVKDSLLMDFLPRKGDEKAQFELEFKFKLIAYDEAKEEL